MRILEKIWNDIRRGENIDLYVTILLSLLLSALNLIGPVTRSQIISLTLAALGVVALSGLRDFTSRATQRELKIKKLLEREKDFFLEIEENTSMLLSQEGK